MYCSACGTPLAPGLSYCNRCGMSLKQESGSSTGLIGAYLAAITIIGTAGLALMLGGAIALKNGGHFNDDLIAVFMLMAFVMVSFVEIFLCRQLSRISRTKEKKHAPAPLPAMPSEFRPPQPRALEEPPVSVTENTTRTLEYSRSEPSKKSTH
jgi:hypothetical protein